MQADMKTLRTRENQDLTRGGISKKIVLFSLPIIAGNLFQQLYNVVDSMIVGNFAANGTACLAAVNASFPVMMLFNSIYMGIAMGANIIISQYKGAKDEANLQTSMTTTFTLSMLCGLIITVLGLCCARPILEMLGTPPDIIGDAAVYLRIVFIGTCGNIVYNGLNGMVRGLGDAKWPMYALIFSALLNIVLDLLFVVVFHWDVAGVAWATIIAHFASGLVMLWKQNTGCYGARIDLRRPVMDKRITKLIFKLGLPAAIQNAAFSAGMLITQGFSNRFGTNYIAANAIIMKVDGFAMMPMMGFGNAITTYVGQNIGAGDIDRTNKGIRVTCLITVVCAAVIGVLLFLFGKFIMIAFGVDELVLGMGVAGIRFLAFFYIFMGLQNVLGGALRGAGASTASAVTSVMGTLIRVPMGWLLAIMPLEKACRAAVEAGEYATMKLAEAAGVGWENYWGLFQTWGFGMVVGFALIVPYYLFGNWRAKGITSKAQQAAGSISKKV